MWIKNERTQEYIPVNEQKTKKVFLDGEKGWCVLQDDGTKVYISDDQKKELDRELNNEHHRFGHRPDEKKKHGDKLQAIRSILEEEDD